ALLISTYELGHQPFGLASPAAWLRKAGLEVRCLDLTKDKLPEDAVRQADLIGFHLAMHTATRLATPVIQKARLLNPRARVCAYGLYAPLNADWLRSIGVDVILGGEFEEDLAAIAQTVSTPVSAAPAHGVKWLPRLQFLPPDRSDLPPLTRYARLHLGDGRQRVAGYTEA